MILTDFIGLMNDDTIKEQINTELSLPLGYRRCGLC